VKKIVAGFVVGVLVAACGPAVADNTDNDRVFRGDRKEYIEHFKEDAEGGKKNYLYTTSEIDAPPPGKCVVATANSEQTITMFCNTTQR
jgi:hypothetical protein